KSKYSLVATAKRGDVHLMSVILGADDKDIRASESVRLLNLGFKKMGITDTVNVNTHTVAPTQNNPVAKYATPSPSQSKPVNYATGRVGVQCGAFSLYETAARQATRLNGLFGVSPDIERNDSGLYRVRFNGLSDSSAQNIKNTASANGIDCYIFH
ncbi:MAG: SPOR domain-containing protein, partial [Alphaproteobacteria bacterium]|nr:SPOR domain-containing protein [Alphaproteobacteria bacterium]